jgi:hypothetical protein
MKSSSEEVTDVLKTYFRMIYRPTHAIDDVVKKPVNLAYSFIIIVIASALLISGVFLVGGALYTTFHDYAFTYPLEYITSGQLFGYYLPYNSYVLVFLTDVLFCIKAWLMLSILLFGFLRIFGQKISIKQSLQVITWSIFPFAIIMFLVSVICLILKFILPMIYHYIYFAVLAGIFIVVAPIIIYMYLDRLKSISIYNALRSYYLSLFVIFAIFTINHATKLMNIIW